VSALFNANTQYLAIFSAPAATQPQTVAGWARMTATRADNGFVFYLCDSGGNVIHGVWVPFSASNINAINEAFSGTPSGSLGTGVWKHFALVRASNVITFYLDGTSIGTVSATNALTPAFFFFGGNGGTAWFNGNLALVRVWEAALSGAEISAERASQTVVRTANLWANYPFTTTTQLNDISGNGRTLSDNGSVTYVAADPTFANPFGAAGTTGAVTASGSLSTSIRLVGAATGAATLSGTLRVGARMAGGSTASAALSGTLATGIRMAGGSTAALTSSGELTVFSNSMAGGASLTASLSGTLTTGIRLVGGATSVLTTTGALTTSIRLAGSTAATGATSGALAAAILLVGGSTATAALAGGLSVGARLSGGAAASVVTDAQLLTAIRLGGSASAGAITSGSLFTRTGFQGGATASAVLSATALSSAVRQALLTQQIEMVTTAFVISFSASSTAQIQMTAGSKIPNPYVILDDGIVAVDGYPLEVV